MKFTTLAMKISQQWYNKYIISKHKENYFNLRLIKNLPSRTQKYSDHFYLLDLIKKHFDWLDLTQIRLPFSNEKIDQVYRNETINYYEWKTDITNNHNTASLNNNCYCSTEQIESDFEDYTTIHLDYNLNLDNETITLYNNTLKDQSNLFICNCQSTNQLCFEIDLELRSELFESSSLTAEMQNYNSSLLTESINKMKAEDFRIKALGLK